MRASDADRDVAVGVLNAAFEDGRLDTLEHAERLERVLAAKTLADLPPLIADVVVSGPAAGPAPARSSHRPMRRVRNAAFVCWVALAALVNVIWAATWLPSGGGPAYYWPIWSMIGTFVPVLVFFLIDLIQSGGRPHPDLGHDTGGRRALESDRQRRERRRPGDR
ncbi:DUF1707 domain-containing protein [Propioniciclava coleopterorum]|uniref:DUF1707 domain-containing protein n=1 Tax=Propioniciclava coleopterorum TaxID=2714937 RepID=A0A6G7YB76_9ACTN|nr:DUF1707 domain-containing protein [Propioniciclava coleopterorum]